VLPTAARDTGTTVFVGGNTATGVDLSSYLASRLPLFIGAVLLFSFVLLTIVFRSLVVALKAAIMNVLSIGAAYGVVVAIFQWGWAKDVVGVDRGGPIEAFIPMMLFAILFGLSMDYEVFLLSRVREEYVRTGDSDDGATRRRELVAPGLARPAPPPPRRGSPQRRPWSRGTSAARSIASRARAPAGLIRSHSAAAHCCAEPDRHVRLGATRYPSGTAVLRDDAGRSWRAGRGGDRPGPSLTSGDR
jgi:hypothetical protein